MGVSMNSLRVENFLIFFTIRCGALTILWSVMLLFPYTLIMFSRILVNGSGVSGTIFFFIYMVLFVGEVMAVLTLIYFPAPNKTYSPDSKTAKYLKYFAWYLCVIFVMFVVLFFFSTVHTIFHPEDSIYYLALHDLFSPHNVVLDTLYFFLSIVVLPYLLIGAVVHLMAVMYTFHLSILPNNNLE